MNPTCLCPICKQLMITPVRIQDQPKKHVFCYQCINHWINIKKSNPLTNKELKGSPNLIRDYEIEKSINKFVDKIENSKSKKAFKIFQEEMEHVRPYIVKYKNVSKMVNNPNKKDNENNNNNNNKGNDDEDEIEYDSVDAELIDLIAKESKREIDAVLEESFRVFNVYGGGGPQKYDKEDDYLDYAKMIRNDYTFKNKTNQFYYNEALKFEKKNANRKIKDEKARKYCNYDGCYKRRPLKGYPEKDVYICQKHTKLIKKNIKNKLKNDEILKNAIINASPKELKKITKFEKTINKCLDAKDNNIKYENDYFCLYYPFYSS